MLKDNLVLRVGEKEIKVSIEEAEGNTNVDEQLQFFGFKVFEYIEYLTGNPDINSEETKRIKQEV